MNNLTPEPRVNKNGIVVTKYVNPEKGKHQLSFDRQARLPRKTPTLAERLEVNSVNINGDGTYLVGFQNAGEVALSQKDIDYLMTGITGLSEQVVARIPWRSPVDDPAADLDRNIVGMSESRGDITVQLRYPHPRSFTIDTVECGVLMHKLHRYSTPTDDGRF